MDGNTKLLFGISLFPAACIAALILLRVCGLVRPFYVPTGGMSPAVSPGDHVFMEGISFLFRKPRRGDIVVFKTDGLDEAIVPPGQLFIKRVAGEPGDRVRISEGNLSVNNKKISLSNRRGEITYSDGGVPAIQAGITVPRGCYFVLGDNSTNSLDSRFWGSLPRDHIIGRISFCYSPLPRVGGVK